MAKNTASASPPKKLVILGAGGHAKVVMDAALLMQRWSEIVFLDDSNQGQTEFMGAPLLGDRSLLGTALQPKDYDVAVAIGNNAIRGEVFGLAAGLGFSFPVIRHPSAVVSEMAEIGEGSVLFANTVINPAVRIGKGAIINTSASVDHDSLLGDFVHVSPGARLAGSTRVGDFSWMGIGSCTREGSTIGSHCIIGAGAVVVSDIPDGITAVGIPAKKLAK